MMDDWDDCDFEYKKNWFAKQNGKKLRTMLNEA
jgi:hypothetical protein